METTRDLAVPPRLNTAKLKRIRRALTPPAELLARLRWIQIRAAIVMLIVWAILLIVSGLPLWRLLLAYAGVGWLGWCWIRIYRGRSPSTTGVLVEGAVLAGLALTDPVSILGLLYPGLFFRGLYGSARHICLLLAVYVAAFLAPLALLESQRLVSAATMFQVTGLVVVAATMYILASSLTERLRAAMRERSLHGAAVDLAAAIERSEIVPVAEAAARALVQHAGSTRIAVMLKDDNSAANMNVWTDDLPADATTLTLPIAVGERVLGRLVAETALPLEPETRNALATLTTQTALAVERADLAADLHQRQGDERFRALIQHSTDITSVYTPDGKIVYASPAMEQALGYKQNELTGRKAMDFVHADDRMAMYRMVTKLRRDPASSHTIDFRALCQDGTWRFMEAVVRDLTGVPAIGGIVGNARDVTERLEAEHRQSESEGRFGSLVEQIPGIAYVFSPSDDLTTRYVSPRVADLTGYPLEQWQSDPNLMVQILHPEDRARVEQAFAASMTSGEPLLLEHRIVSRRGPTIWVHHAAEQAAGDGAGAPVWHGLLLDITERKEAEHLTRLLERTSLAIGTAIDLDEGLLQALKLVCEETGWVYGGSWSPDDVGTLLRPGPIWYEDPSLDAFAAGSAEVAFASSTGLPGRVLASGRPAWISSIAADTNFPRRPVALEAGLKAAVAVPVISDQGVVAVLEFFARERLEPDDQLTTLVTVVAAQLGSLVAAKRAEADLRQSEERYRAVVGTAVDAIVSGNSQGQIIDWNRSAEAIFGYRAEEMLGRPITIIMPERFHAAHLEGFRRVLGAGRRT